MCYMYMYTIIYYVYYNFRNEYKQKNSSQLQHLTTYAIIACVIFSFRFCRTFLQHLMLQIAERTLLIQVMQYNSIHKKEPTYIMDPFQMSIHIYIKYFSFY